MSILQTSILIADVMLPLDRFPVLKPIALFRSALEEMSKARLGIACVVDDSTKLLGIITDGDIRRQLLHVQKPFSAFFSDDIIDHAVRGPVTVLADATLESAVDLMEEKQVWDLPVVDEAGRLVGLLHLHPVVQVLMARTV